MHNTLPRQFSICNMYSGHYYNIKQNLPKSIQLIKKNEHKLYITYTFDQNCSVSRAVCLHQHRTSLQLLVLKENPKWRSKLTLKTVENLRMITFICRLLWLFYQYLGNRSSFLLEIIGSATCAAMLVRPVPMKSTKKFLNDVMYIIIHLRHTSRPCSWRHRHRLI